MEERQELRQHVARVLERHAGTVVNDALDLWPFTGATKQGRELSRRQADAMLRLLAGTARAGRADARSALLADLRTLARQSLLAVGQLFHLGYLLERSALDELALDESFGITSEPWAGVAQLVRQASVDLMAAYAEALESESDSTRLIDPLTTLHTGELLMTALEKEIQRSERAGHALALIVLDVDHLARINQQHGYGFGDRVLERIGINLRSYFREQDWVARLTGDRFGVLLPETSAGNAESLAERVRATIEQRFALTDYRSDAPVAVTVSIAAVFVEPVEKSTRAEQVMNAAQDGLARAKQAGRNRVERVRWTAGVERA